MSVPSNLSQWHVGIPPSQSVFEESTSKEARYGQEIQIGDRKFRYSKAATNLAAGDVLVVGADGDVNKSTVGAAVAVGTFKVPVYSANDLAAHAYDEGYLTVMDSTGQGISYRIKEHGALTATTAGQLVTLYDPIASGGAMGSTTKLTLSKNPWSKLAAGTDGNATAPCYGIAPIAVTSGNYFWACVNGPIGVKAGGALTFGQKAAVGTTGGALAVDATANATQLIGTVLSVTGTALDHVLTWVDIAR